MRFKISVGYLDNIYLGLHFVLRLYNAWTLLIGTLSH